MTTEVLSQTVAAGGTMVLPRGRQLYLVTAGSAVNIAAYRVGSGANVERFNGVSAGFNVKLADVADSFVITSPGAQTITVAVGDEDVSFSNAVTISGNVAAYPLSSSVTGAADVLALGAGATDSTTIPQNLNRKRIWIGVLSTKTQGVRVRPHGTAAGGIEIQPGIFEPFDTTAALDIYNPGAAATDWYWQEET